jgi:hypothetical protein
MRRGLLATRQELSELKERIGHLPFADFYDRLDKRCALILQSTPTTEMNWQAAWANGRYGAAVTAARGAQGRIIDLIIADAIDKNTAYRTRAIEELMNLLQWSTWVDPSRPELSFDRCTAEASLACVLGLDWLWEFLTEDQRGKTETALRQRVIEPYLDSVRRQVWWRETANHWNAVLNAAAGMAALALGDEDQQAALAYEQAKANLKPFYNALGQEGGWEEGIGYWGYAIRSVLLLAETSARLLDDQSLLHHRGMDRTALFPIYFSPNGHAASFGDSAELPLHGALYLLARYFDRPEVIWWLDEYTGTHDVSTFGWSTAGLSILFHPAWDGKPRVEPKLAPVKVYEQIGWGAMADHWPHPTFYVAAKTGDLSASHAQRDMNSIQLQIDGEMLLADVGHPSHESGYFSDARSDYYEVQARAHNTVTIAEEDHRPDTIGRIIAHGHSDGTRWMTCDSKEACGEAVKFFRHLVMQSDGQDQFLVVLDELNLVSPEQADLYWHAGGTIEMDAERMVGRIAGLRTALHFGLACSVPATLTQHTRQLQHHRNDPYLRVSAGMIDRGFFATIFSRNRLKTPLQLHLRDDNGVRLNLGKRQWSFRPGKGCLRPEIG